ncbi:MAG: hypothetical protein WKF97_09485 [Chitinophagaceae bacterium]
MKNEVFDVEVEYGGQKFTLKVKADLPVGPEPFGSDYDIFIEGKHRYTINHCKNEDDVHCWEVKKQPRNSGDPEFAHAIGKAIDRHYLN